MISYHMIKGSMEKNLRKDRIKLNIKLNVHGAVPHISAKTQLGH